MHVPDGNLLLYACDTTSPFHERAWAWWQECLSGEEAVGLTCQILARPQGV
jgi:predicted nucleic acid-binding protein